MSLVHSDGTVCVITEESFLEAISKRVTHSNENFRWILSEGTVCVITEESRFLEAISKGVTIQTKALILSTF